MPADRWPRIALAVAVVAGLSNAVLFPLNQPNQVALATDVYYHAASAALDGADFYAARPPGRPGVAFRYPPFAVVGFLPHALLGDATLAYALQTALNLATAGALAVLVVRAIEHAGVELEPVDRFFVVGYAFASVPAVTNLVMGQINVQLAVAVAAGALYLERDREWECGIALGAAALVKLFPALLGAWLLRLRAWRAIAAGTATGVGLSLLGLAAFGPGPTETFLASTIPHEMAVASFPDGPDPTEPYVTIRRQFAFLLPWLPTDWYLPAGAVVLAPVVVGVNRVVADFESRLVALAGTLLATLILFPLEPFYLTIAVFPLVSLLYVLEPGRLRGLFVAGTLVLSLPLTYESVLVLTSGDVLPTAVGSVVRDVARATFALALPSMVGVWLVLAACLWYQHRASLDFRSRSA